MNILVAFLVHFFHPPTHTQYNSSLDMLSDAQRIHRVKMLVESGYADRVVIAQDIHMKHRLVYNALKLHPVQPKVIFFTDKNFAKLCYIRPLFRVINFCPCSKDQMLCVIVNMGQKKFNLA